MEWGFIDKMNPQNNNFLKSCFIPSGISESTVPSLNAFLSCLRGFTAETLSSSKISKFQPRGLYSSMVPESFYELHTSNPSLCGRYIEISWKLHEITRIFDDCTCLLAFHDGEELFRKIVFIIPLSIISKRILYFTLGNNKLQQSH